MPLSTHKGLWALQMSGATETVNTFEWISETETLRIYTTDTSTHWQKIASEYLPHQNIEVIRSKNSKKRIDAVLAHIMATGGVLPDGSRIVTAVPAFDGSQITLGIDHKAASPMLAPTEVGRALGTDIPMVSEEAPNLTAALRNHDPSDPYWFSGAYMRTKEINSSWYACTTGFRIGELSGTGKSGMLSADHCGRDKPTDEWYYSGTSNQTITNRIGHFQGPITAIGYQSDTALWIAGNVSKLYPIVFTGSYTDVNSIAAIQGGTFPAVGANVCYSGSQTGNVCGNEVTVQSSVVCYSVTQCYGPVSYTTQTSGTPAAGNGDSGGPVYQNVGGKIMAAGVISGIVNGSTNCTGEPGVNGRLCSASVIYAPIAAALGSGSGWGLSYYP